MRLSNSKRYKGFIKSAVIGTLTVSCALATSGCSELFDVIEEKLESAAEESSLTEDSSADGANDVNEESEADSAGENDASSEDASHADETERTDAASSEDNGVTEGGASEEDTDSAEPSDAELSDAENLDTDSTEAADSLSLAADVFVESASSIQYEAYKKILDEYIEKCSDPLNSYEEEYCRYYVTDIEGNGVNELLIETATCEADRSVDIYAFDGKEAKYLGSFITWKATLGSGDGVIYSETAAMGSYTLNTVTTENGEVVFERGETTDESQLSHLLSFYALDDASGIE